MKRNQFFKTNFIAFALCSILFAQGQSRYVTGDFHQHTTYTDGSYTIGHMMQKNNQFGLDWWANSEHGGAFERWGIVSGIDLGTSVIWSNAGITAKGNANGNNMWRWQSLTEWSFRDLLLYRQVYPNKVIIQAYEMNVPGHEHASMGLIGNQFHSTNPDVNALATFEYLFDAADVDNSQPFGITETKNTTNNHGKAVQSVTWLQKHYPTQSWVIPAHPERFRYPSGTPNYEGWNIEHIRDMNNAAPDVFFGFESFPGHQAAGNRGEYHKGRGLHGSYGICTYGGCGFMSAKIGGFWDALLSEGRRFWLFASSDCHIVTNANGSFANADFYPGEYQKTYTYVNALQPQAIVNGLRSGNSWVVSGDLIDQLEFTVGNAVMGQTAQTNGNGKATITVKVHQPQTPNHNIYSSYTTPELDHFDIIAGVVGSRVTPPATVPADGITGYSNAYKCDTVTTTRVVARFGKSAAPADPNGIPTQLWTNEGNGFYSASYEITLPAGVSKMYIRLRGTNLALNTLKEIDACGNPLPDTLMGTNNAEKAFADLWFYSNPIFLSNGTGIVNSQIDNINIYPNPTNDYIYISGATVRETRIFTVTGSLVKEQLSSLNEINISNLASGMYILQIVTDEGMIVNRQILKK